MADGVVTATSPDAESGSGVVAFPGSFALPGFIDIHAHVGEGISKYGVGRWADDGVVALLSQGDAGPANIERFLAATGPEARFALSVASDGEEGEGPCYDSPHRLEPEAAVEAFERHPDRLWGVSVNLGRDACGRVSPDLVLDVGLEVADEVGVPVLCGTGELEKTDVAAHVSRLRAGDVLTYLFRPGPYDLFSIPEVAEAVAEAHERGVVLDASHGSGSFDYGVARRAMALGVLPDTASSDLSAWCVEAPEETNPGRVAGKLMTLGMDTDDAMATVTTTPAGVLGLGSPVLAVGSSADLTIVRWMEPAPLPDTSGAVMVGPWLQTVATIRGGEVVYSRSG